MSKYFLHGAKEVLREEVEEYFNEDFDDNFEDLPYYLLDNKIIKELKKQKFDYKTTFPSNYIKEYYPKLYDDIFFTYIDIDESIYTYLKIEHEDGNIEYKFFEWNNL